MEQASGTDKRQRDAGGRKASEGVGVQVPAVDDLLLHGIALLRPSLARKRRRLPVDLHAASLSFLKPCAATRGSARSRIAGGTRVETAARSPASGRPLRVLALATPRHPLSWTHRHRMGKIRARVGDNDRRPHDDGRTSSQWTGFEAAGAIPRYQYACERIKKSTCRICLSLARWDGPRLFVAGRGLK